MPELRGAIQSCAHRSCADTHPIDLSWLRWSAQQSRGQVCPQVFPNKRRHRTGSQERSKAQILAVGQAWRLDRRPGMCRRGDMLGRVHLAVAPVPVLSNLHLQLRRADLGCCRGDGRPNPFTARLPPSTPPRPAPPPRAGRFCRRTGRIWRECPNLIP